MMKGERLKIMRTTRMYILLICLLTFAATQIQAVDYRTTFRSSQPQSSYREATFATTPAVGFRSTSVYSTQWTEQENTLLNSDGSMNEATYISGRSNVSGPRRIINPDGEDEDDKENGTPIGNAVLPLLLMALAFISLRLYRRRKA